MRSRTFSGPYVGSTLSSRIRLAGLVAALVAGNTLLNPGADLQRTFGAAVAVFLFNIMYELILSQRLKQYAMCPVIDLLNHSSTEAVSCACVCSTVPRTSVLYGIPRSRTAMGLMLPSSRCTTCCHCIKKHGSMTNMHSATHV